MEFERKQDVERKELQVAQATPDEVERADVEERKELGEMIRKEDTREEKERSKNKICSFGPSFDLPYAESEK